MPFVLLVLALLGGGLVCLLVINTTLGSTSFRISQLQTQNANLSLQQQSLQGQIQSEAGPAQIERKAYQLGMRAETSTSILDLRKHRFYRLAGGAGTADLMAPGPVPSTGSAGKTTGTVSKKSARTGTTTTRRHRRRRHRRTAAAGTTGNGAATTAGSGR